MFVIDKINEIEYTKKAKLGLKIGISNSINFFFSSSSPLATFYCNRFNIE